MKPGIRKTRTLLLNLALLVISSGITIVGVDVVLRLFGDELIYYRPHEMFVERWPEMPLVGRYKKNVDYSGETYGDLAAMIGDDHLREGRHIVFKTDSFGFRNSEEIPDHEAYDLIVLGDSFGVGNGTTQESTWVALLQRRYGLRTYNLSMAGSPWQSYVHLATEITRLQVHERSIVLLTLFSGNDLDEYYYHRDVELSDLPWNGIAARLGARIATFTRRSPIRQMVSGLLHRNRSIADVLVMDFLDGRKMLLFQPHATRMNRTEAMIRNHPNYDRLLDAIRRIKRIAAEHNSTVVILLLPSKEEVYEWVLDGSPPWTTDTRPSGFATAVGNFCRQSNLSCFDLEPSLVEASEEEFKESGELIYWTDDTHWNEKGHSIVADIVFRTVFSSSSAALNGGMHTDGGSAALNSRR